MSDKDMAHCLCRTCSQVRKHRVYMGLLRAQGCRRWTKEEDAYLEDNWGDKTAPEIARKLGRTTTSVISRAKLSGLGAQTGNDELMTKEDVTIILGLKRRETIDDWEKLGLKVKKKSIREPGKYKRTRKTWLIRFSDLLEWLEAHQDKWDSRRIPEYGLGVEYDWLKEKRKADKEKSPLPRKWTDYELSVLKARVARMDPYKDIARDLGRTVVSCRGMAYQRGYCVRHCGKGAKQVEGSEFNGSTQTE